MEEVDGGIGLGLDVERHAGPCNWFHLRNGSRAESRRGLAGAVAFFRVGGLCWNQAGHHFHFSLLQAVVVIAPSAAGRASCQSARRQ